MLKRKNHEQGCSGSGIVFLLKKRGDQFNKEWFINKIKRAAGRIKEEDAGNQQAKRNWLNMLKFEIYIFMIQMQNRLVFGFTLLVTLAALSF